MHSTGFSRKLKSGDKLLQSIFTIKHVIMGNYYRGDTCSITCPDSLSSPKDNQKSLCSSSTNYIIPILIISSTFKEVLKNTNNKIEENKELCKRDSILYRKTLVCGSSPQRLRLFTAVGNTSTTTSMWGLNIIIPFQQKSKKRNNYSQDSNFDLCFVMHQEQGMI